jgi:hypothetical protein
MRAVFRDWDGLNLIELSGKSDSEFCEIEELGSKLGLQIASVNLDDVKYLKRIYPDYSLNSYFNLIFGLNPFDLVSKKLRFSIEKISQLEPMSGPYIFMDHHKGTEREIPSNVIDRIKSTGLTIFENPRDQELFRLLHVIDSAVELHLVNSAPLCLALTTDAKPKNRIHYDSLNDPVTKSYSGWSTVSIAQQSNTGVFADHVVARPLLKSAFEIALRQSQFFEVEK